MWDADVSAFLLHLSLTLQLHRKRESQRDSHPRAAGGMTVTPGQQEVVEVALWDIQPCGDTAL